MSRASARALGTLCAWSLATALPVVASAAPFTYDPAGTLVPSTSGKGRVDAKVYEPTMLYPVEQGESFANSQVYGRGGGSGPGGSQCDKENFSYPWHDNYCESRSWDMPLCPSGTGHQGQDIRASTCTKNVHNVVAAEDGTITNVGSYSVYLTTAAGTRFDYLHMGSVAVKVGQAIKRGTMLGKVSNEFGGTPTTVHLHFNIRQNVASLGNVYVPPYTSLVESYKRHQDPNYGKDAGTDAAPPIVDSGVTQPVVADASPKPIAKPAATTEPAPPGEDGCATSAPGLGGSAFGAAFGLGLGLTVLARRRLRRA